MPDKETSAQKIMQVMQNQERCWNKGDIDGFMEGYWNSDSLMFVGSSGITYGWKQTLENYKSKYNSPDKMGKLTFTVLNLQIEGKSAYLIGKWELARTGKEKNIGGHFTLFWRQIEGKWYIVSDHTS